MIPSIVASAPLETTVSRVPCFMVVTMFALVVAEERSLRLEVVAYGYVAIS